MLYLSPMPKQPCKDRTGKVLPGYMQPTRSSWSTQQQAWVSEDYAHHSDFLHGHHHDKPAHGGSLALEDKSKLAKSGGAYAPIHIDGHEEPFWRHSLRGTINTSNYDTAIGPEVTTKTMAQRHKDNREFGERKHERSMMLVEQPPSPPPPPFFVKPSRQQPAAVTRPARMVVTIECVVATPCGLGLGPVAGGRTMVHHIAPNGNAQLAGVQAGDVILQARLTTIPLTS